MSELGLIVFITLIGSNLITAFYKSPIRAVNFILLLQFGISYLFSLFLIPNYNLLLVFANILIDAFALTLIAGHGKQALKQEQPYHYLITVIECLIYTMINTHFLALFRYIPTFEEYFYVLNILSLGAGFFGLIGGIIGIAHGVNDYQDNIRYSHNLRRSNNKRVVP